MQTLYMANKKEITLLDFFSKTFDVYRDWGLGFFVSKKKGFFLSFEIIPHYCSTLCVLCLSLSVPPNTCASFRACSASKK